jgi:arsenate reductase (glutaredoxin)
MIVYGIKNCDTVKKSLTWLKENGISFEFHDYKTEGISKKKLTKWSQQVGWEVLLNKKGTTWRNIDPETQQTIDNEESAVELMEKNTSVIKRPVIEQNGQVLFVGFDAEKYAEKLIKNKKS